MPIGLKESEPVIGYIPRTLKKRIERLRQRDRRLSISRVIEEALIDYLPKIEHDRSPAAKPPREG